MIRRWIFYLFFTIWSVLTSIIFSPLLLLNEKYLYFMTHVWAGGVVKFCRIFLGIRWEVKGREHIPEGPCIIASNHQSIWETVVLYLLLDRSLYVLKQELAKNPLWGGYMLKIGCIPVDREAGIAALKDLVHKASARFEDGKKVILFPEGTRMPPGEMGEFQAGIAAIYTANTVPVCLLAHNAGLCMPKKGAYKKGTITFEFLPPIEPGLKRKAFMTKLENDITTKTMELSQKSQQSDR